MKRNNLPLWHNRIIWFELGHLLYLLAIYKYCGSYGLYYQAFITLLHTFTLETINYVEHYGLERKKDANGVYESVSIKHSWNAPQLYSNWASFKL